MSSRHLPALQRWLGVHQSEGVYWSSWSPLSDIYKRGFLTPYVLETQRLLLSEFWIDSAGFPFLSQGLSQKCSCSLIKAVTFIFVWARVESLPSFPVTINFFMLGILLYKKNSRGRFKGVNVAAGSSIALVLCFATNWGNQRSGFSKLDSHHF